MPKPDAGRMILELTRMSVEGIYIKLKDAGITGRPWVPDSCPVAVYLRTQASDAGWVRVSPSTIGYGPDEDSTEIVFNNRYENSSDVDTTVLVLLPNCPLGTFIARFDNGHFPDLREVVGDDAPF